ncbi:interleukin-3 receptor subunit alpha-like isoform X2 [Acomys russatus]|uniref:interleukin-3 receptor subunit alpha-like isoform X2 n=1 Tax=Acomys russatus TaxID=60746 RepID=UPI0021E2A667|nr:interleukin-3 receptor subunit alpha-like isoform X2 [Acomys russatus]
MAERSATGVSQSNWPSLSADCSPRRNHVTVTVLSLLAVGTGLTVLGTLLLCQRRALMKKLFPPIPHMKDPTADRAEPGELVTWTLAPEECEVTQVTEA